MNRAVFHWGSRGSSKVSLGLTIPYHSMPCRWLTPVQLNSHPGVGHLQSECTVLFQRPPGPPMKYGPVHEFEIGLKNKKPKNVWIHLTTRRSRKTEEKIMKTHGRMGESHGQADHNNE
jgi:hypothetical protein